MKSLHNFAYHFRSHNLWLIAVLDNAFLLVWSGFSKFKDRILFLQAYRDRKHLIEQILNLKINADGCGRNSDSFCEELPGKKSFYRNNSLTAWMSGFLVSEIHLECIIIWYNVYPSFPFFLNLQKVPSFHFFWHFIDIFMISFTTDLISQDNLIAWFR